MKRRFYALILVVAMLAMTLVACGSDTTTNNTQKEEQSVEQQEPIEEIIDADGTFEIKYIFEIENGDTYVQEGNRIDLSLYDNNDNEIYNNTLFKNVSTEELFTQFENVVTDEMVSNFIDEHYDATLSVWDEEKIPDDIYKMDEYPQVVNLNLGNANFNINIELEECYLRSLNCEAANSDEFIYDYVLILDDKFAKSLCGLCYKLTGTYTCDINVSELALNTAPEPVQEENIESETINYAYAYDLKFPEWMTGFTKKYLNETVPEWSLNETHYVDTNGNEMNFEWEGFATLGENAGVNGNTLNLVDPERGAEIRAWHGGPMNMEDIEPCLTADSTAWTNSTSAYCSLPENGYYNVEQIENTVVITYEVIDNNSGKVGYVRFICNADIGEVYNFMYLETPETFDKDRAMFVINSIEYWNYIP